MIIHQISWILNKNINRKLLSGFFLLLLFFPTASTANNPPQTKQHEVNSSKTNKRRKPRKPPSDYSRAGGSRGCPGKTNIPLTVLAPNTFVGETTSVRPTFAWFVSKAQPTEFRLFELDASTSTPKRIGTPIKLQSELGINQLSLTENQPALTVGKTYIWQVSIDCPDSPFIQRAEIMVVQKPALNDKLNKMSNDSQKAYIYAEEDLWYEALEEALKVAPQGKLGQLGSEIVQKLAQSDNFIPERSQSDGTDVLQNEIQLRRNYLEQIAKEN